MKSDMDNVMDGLRDGVAIAFAIGALLMANRILEALVRIAAALEKMQ